MFIKKWDKNKSLHNDHIKKIMFIEKRDEKLERSHICQAYLHLKICSAKLVANNTSNDVKFSRAQPTPSISISMLRFGTQPCHKHGSTAKPAMFVCI